MIDLNPIDLIMSMFEMTVIFLLEYNLVEKDLIMPMFEMAVIFLFEHNLVEKDLIMPIDRLIISLN